MELTEREEEALEALWIQTKEEGQEAVTVNKLDLDRDQPEDAEHTPPSVLLQNTARILEGLEAAGYVALTDRGYRLTEVGEPAAANVVRRHRLAERLLADVLDAWNDASHEKACKFEHLLDRGLDDRICSLLGHPRVCPHGKPIPPGKCCKEMRESASRLVSPLSHLVEGQRGKVAYIYSQKPEQLQKLTAMGILPGASISIIQTFPAYVFQAGQTQFAVDREIADAIYVRLSDTAEEAGQAGAKQARRRTGWRWR